MLFLSVLKRSDPEYSWLTFDLLGKHELHAECSRAPQASSAARLFMEFFWCRRQQSSSHIDRQKKFFLFLISNAALRWKLIRPLRCLPPGMEIFYLHFDADWSFIFISPPSLRHAFCEMNSARIFGPCTGSSLITRLGVECSHAH